MPFEPYGTNAGLAEVLRTRRNDQAAISSLEQSKLDGRWVNRAVPASPSDIRQGDALGDKLNDGTYMYELILVSGVLIWNQQTLNVTW